MKSEVFWQQKESSNTKIQAFQLFPLFQLDDDHVVDFALLLGHSDNAQDSRQLESRSASTSKKDRTILTGNKPSASLLLQFQASACAMNLDDSVLSQMQLDSCNPTLKLRSVSSVFGGSTQKHLLEQAFLIPALISSLVALHKSSRPKWCFSREVNFRLVGFSKILHSSMQVTLPCVP